MKIDRLLSIFQQYVGHPFHAIASSFGYTGDDVMESFLAKHQNTFQVLNERVVADFKLTMWLPMKNETLSKKRRTCSSYFQVESKHQFYLFILYGILT